MTKRSSLNKELTLHLGLIFIISLLLLIPKIFFDSVLSDRQYMQDSAIRSITSSWGGEQTIAPPVLIFAATKERVVEVSKNGEQRLSVEQFDLLLAPRITDIQIHFLGQERQRGIYRANLYRAEVSMSGTFSLNDLLDRLQEAQFEGVSVLQSSPYILFPILEASGIDSVEELKINGVSLTPRPGQKNVSAQMSDGFMAILAHSLQTREVSFSCSYTLRGSLMLALQALSGQINVHLDATALSPSFSGRFLPVKHNITADGFSAQYNISSLASGYSELYSDNLPEKSDIVVDIQQGRQHYAYIERLSKYALFFIAMTFVTVLAFELLSRTMVSLVQYAVTGAGLISFYLVLLSLSEHISFGLSYACGAVLLSIMIALYMKAVFKQLRQGIALFAILLALYLILYAIVNAENYALLIGTALLVLMLGVIMYLTRHINDHCNGDNAQE